MLALLSPVMLGTARGRWHGRGVSGGTALYDSIFLAADDVLKKQEGRKAVVLLSDGDDNGSKTSIGSAIESAQRADMPVYSINFSDLYRATIPTNRAAAITRFLVSVKRKNMTVRARDGYYT